MHAALVVTVVVAINGFRNPIVYELDHVKEIVLRIVRDMYLDRIQIRFPYGSKDGYLDVAAQLTRNTSRVHTIVTKRLLKVALPSELRIDAEEEPLQ